MTKNARGRLRELLNHPWVLVLGGSLLGAVATEVTPLKLITKYVGPIAVAGSIALTDAVSVPLWTLPALALLSAFVPWVAVAMLRRAMRSSHIIVEGIKFQAGHRTVVCGQYADAVAECLCQGCNQKNGGIETTSRSSIGPMSLTFLCVRDAVLSRRWRNRSGN